MIMADVFKILFPVVGTLMSFVCFWLLYEAIFPAAVERCRVAYMRRPIRAVLLGALITAPTMFVGLSLIGIANPVTKFFGFTILCFLMLLGILGSAGLSRLIGVRLASIGDEHQPWRRVLRGGIVLSITFLFPVVGWFLVLPVTLVSGVGASVLAWWSARGAARRPQPAGAGLATA